MFGFVLELLLTPAWNPSQIFNQHEIDFQIITANLKLVMALKFQYFITWSAIQSSKFIKIQWRNY
jgi:hypothetical protein